MAELYPYLKFNDRKCKEAMTFYQKCFGGKLEFMTIGESPMADKFPKEDGGKIMHSTLVKGDMNIFGADMMRDRAVVGDNVTITLDCKSEKELKDLFSKLSKGGEVFMEPEEQFWGGVFGVLTDKYGVEWSMNFQKKPMKPMK